MFTGWGMGDEVEKHRAFDAQPDLNKMMNCKRRLQCYNVAKLGIFYKIMRSEAAQAHAAKYMQILSLLYPEVVSFPQ